MPAPQPIVVIEESESGLLRQRWVFAIEEPNLILDRYYYERRRSSSQQFVTVKFYDRHRDPDEEYGDWAWLTEDQVPWDDDLKGLALDEMVKRWAVVRKSEL